MAVTLDFSRPLTYEDVGMIPSAVGDMVIAQTAARLFAKVQKGWPVDTSFSRGGLAYRLERIPNGARIIFTNLRDYAIWVERRWYPLDKVVTEGAVRSAAREARKTPEAEKVPNRLSNLTNNRARSRPVTVRRIEPPKAVRGTGAPPSPPRPRAPSLSVVNQLISGASAAVKLLREEAEEEEGKRRRRLFRLFGF